MYIRKKKKIISGTSDEKDGSKKGRNKEPEDLNDDSCSSDDAPLQGRLKDNGFTSDSKLRETGAKRKAEVLSKESGKIGVTITTSPGGNSSPPPVKIPKIKENLTSNVSLFYFLSRLRFDLFLEHASKRKFFFFFLNFSRVKKFLIEGSVQKVKKNQVQKVNHRPEKTI